MIKIWSTSVMYPTWDKPRKICFNSKQAAENVRKLYPMSDKPVYLGRYKETAAVPVADMHRVRLQYLVKVTYYRSVSEYCVLEGVTS